VTARVMLDLDDGQEPGAQWLQDLLAWDLSHLWGERAQSRCLAMIAIVARQHTAVQAHGPTSWPTLPQLASHLSSRGEFVAVEHSDVTQLLTVAVAAGWLKYEDDGARR
jgi:hypothetical protein